MIDKQHTLDIEQLIALPAFKRHMLRLIQSAGIFAPATNGSDGRNLSFAEGRRHLGLDVLRDVERGMPAPHAQGFSTLIQLLLEEAQSHPQEKPSGRRDRYSSDDEPDDGSPGDS